jgi:hypothetical protein
VQAIHKPDVAVLLNRRAVRGLKGLCNLSARFCLSRNLGRYGGMTQTLASTLRAALVGGLCAYAMVALPVGAVLSQEQRREWQAELPEQQPLIERALAAIKPSDRARRSRHLYFVGFAGFGHQAVFKREVEEVRKLFDERFDTRERSVALINHPSTIAEVPLATVENLTQVLTGLGRIMDSANDVLFLFVTTHGVKSVLAVEMPFVGLDHLQSRTLKAMLDKSGIKNRILVLSACHSGSFIPALADARTLVIAAAHADRTSFGCDDKRAWTYFGDAYFNRALREETSFKRAFIQAREQIRVWESAAKLTPSLPQMKGGEALRLDE